MGKSIALTYDAASTTDSFNSRLDQTIYSPCSCASSSIRDILNWLHSGAQAMTDPRANIFTNQMVGMRPLANFPALPTTPHSHTIVWTSAGPHKIIVADDTQFCIRTRSAGPVGSVLFNLDWCNYLLQPKEDDGLYMSQINANGRSMAVHSSVAFIVGDFLRAKFFLSPMGCASSSKHLLRL